MADLLPCPNCGDDMADGELSISGTALGFLVAGISYQRLWWKAAGAPRNERTALLQTREGCVASRCDRCGLVAFLPPHRRARLFSRS